MLRMLDLIFTILKCYLILTVVRLVTTAFGWEFGVSRQYLRLLEWIFHLGQKRIEKVESEHRLHHEHDGEEERVEGGRRIAPLNGRDGQRANGRERRGRLAFPSLDLELVDDSVVAVDADNDLATPSDRDDADEEQEMSNSRSKPTSAPSLQVRDSFDSESKVGPRFGNIKLKDHLLHKTTGNAPSRRVSTPDGPPIFLLDDYDEESNLDPSIFAKCQLNQQQQHEFHLVDAAHFVVKGVSAIIDDEVTKRFTTEQLKTWNLLTRTNAKNYQFMSRSLGLCWLVGFLVRYVLLLPLRIMYTVVGFAWLIATMSLIGLLPKGWRKWPYKLASLMAFRMLSCGITSRLAFHNRQFKARPGDICVANHTSPLDVVLLACDNCYALVGQRHAGLLGLLEAALSRATNHVWFDRSEMRDRQLVTQRLREHVSSGKNLPVLIFPEGTCINNSAVMMFRKGSFETTDRVCPVAIKYDARFGDPFWNSSKQSYVQYLLLMMSSWAIKCDVWYLPPMERLQHESSAEFANRVKAEIAKQGGLVDLAWDGQLKRSSIKPSWLYQQQEDYAKRLKLD